MTKLTRNTDQLFAEVAEHVAQDRIIQGTYGEYTENGFRGCFLGCLAHSKNGGDDFYDSSDTVRRVIERFNFTEPFLRIAESIFEGLPADEARQFFADFPAAVGTDGKDLSLVHWQFFAADLRALPPVPADVQVVIDPVIAGMDLLANGQEWPEAGAAEAAAWAARAAARGAEAAEAAAWGAEAAEAAAWAARAAARGAEAAEAAAWAARAAAWGAEAADAAAWGAARRQRDLFLELVGVAPVEVQP